MDNQTAAPTTWPGAFGIYKRSKEAIMLNIKPFLGLLLLYIVVSILAGILLSVVGVANNSPLMNLVDLIISSGATVSFTLLILAGIRGQKMEFSPAAKSALSFMTVKVIGLSILMALILFVSILLLIVPFFFVLPRIALAPYFLIDKNMGVTDSLRASWDATKGSMGKVWGVIGVTILFGIMIIVLVGIYLSIMYAAAFGLLYLHLANKEAPLQAATETPATSVPAEVQDTQNTVA